MAQTISKIPINSKILRTGWDKRIFENFHHYPECFVSHLDIFEKLKDKNPYTITILIENINPKIWNRKEYVKKTKDSISSRYHEELYKAFFYEHGERKGYDVYAKYLKKYRNLWKKDKSCSEIDGYIIKHELEPKYSADILKRFKNHQKLKRLRFRTNRDRYYNVPLPGQHVDWRNPYDTIFVWEADGKKYYLRGGSGSSGQRETNSLFCYGFSLINQVKPVASYLFIYSENNRLLFVKKCRSLTVPDYDIGSNYHLKPGEGEEVLKNTGLLRWDMMGRIKHLEIFN